MRTKRNVPAVIRKAFSAPKLLEKASTAEEVRDIEKLLAVAEEMMQQTGLFQPDEIRKVNETRMQARWKLGQFLAKMERSKPFPGSRTKLTGLVRFKEMLKKLNLTDPVAIEAQRIGTLPRKELEKALRDARERKRLTSFDDLVDVARPYWYQVSRKRRHRAIADEAEAAQQPDAFGPFPLIYADPPWKFQIYSEKGLERTPDQHYPTLTDEEISAFEIYGQKVWEIAADNAALLMWCTSSNMERALKIMRAWDFQFKTSAVWDKQKTGLGLVFRNQHEVLLYGTRGNMPGPQFQPASVFNYPRGKHSAKPPEVRQAIERMYPDFTESTRLELFARGKIEGWSTYGFEARSKAA